MRTPEQGAAAAHGPSRRPGRPPLTRTLWRIATDTPGYGADDLTGAGARATGGRWNRSGTAMVYASTSRALACLETVVHLHGAGMPLNRYLVAITVTEADWRARAVFRVDEAVGWDAQPAGLVSLDWGTMWAARSATLLAEVPSAIVPEETNVLINPAHARVAHVTASKVRRWLYDPRMFVAGGEPPRRRRST
ncbi:MAG: RES family NAD+ phosphorylase [Gemmatimonadaceae bacterium]|nr:RES family NAD+ phosphorylase [Gemmatimonadaceae bacterium]